MKSKIFLTLLIIGLFIGVNIILNNCSYAVDQNYAQVAAQQVNSDVYYTLKTQSGISSYAWLIKIGVIIIGSFFIYKVWVPKVKTNITE
jgi:hypothetical protein